MIQYVQIHCFESTTITIRTQQVQILYLINNQRRCLYVPNYYSTFIRIGSFNEEKININMDRDNKEEDDLVNAFDNSNSKDVTLVYASG